MILNNDHFNQFPLTGWFPGHMLKAGRQMQEALQLVDLVVELVDARAPLATRNPALRKFMNNKPFLMVANKADLARQSASRLWEDWYRKQGIRAFFLDSHKIANVRGLTQLWRRIVLEERSARGAVRPLLRPVRIMIVGIPNIGKSTLVNRLYEKKKAVMGPKPGVTRQTQWIPLSGEIELLDTPGVMWPRVRNKCHELLLTVLGNIRDEVIGIPFAAEFLAWVLMEQNLPQTWEKLGLPGCPDSMEELVRKIAERRGLLMRGGELDVERASAALLKEFREGRLGRMTLELPPAEKEDIHG